MVLGKTETTVRQIFNDYLKDNKFRRTPERYAILNAIYSINGYFEIEELSHLLEEKEKFHVSRATLYNTISLLMDANLVTHHQFGKISRYEKCYNVERHHFICTHCGKVTDVSGGNLLEKLKNESKRFQVMYYSLHIYGLCNKCNALLKRKQKKNRNKEANK